MSFIIGTTAFFFFLTTSLVAQKVKRLPAMQETRVQSLGREDYLEKEMATPLQYSCLENFMDRGALYATVHGVTKSGTRLSDFTHSLTSVFTCGTGASLVPQTVKNLPAMWQTRVWSLGQEDSLEKGLATHSRVLALRISWTEEPGGLESMSLQRVRHDWVDWVTNTFTFPKLPSHLYP